jgi:hypothetical protein
MSSVMKLICWWLGHRPYWDVSHDTKVFRCSRCWHVRPRLTSDCRELQKNLDIRYRMRKQDQALARWVGLRRLQMVPKSEMPEIVEERYGQERA